jgi:aminobenzoyl-glutamate utilization protein B
MTQHRYATSGGRTPRAGTGAGPPALRFAAAAVVLVGLAAGRASAQDAKAAIAASLERKASHYGALAQQLWDLAEVGYLEERSTALLQAELRAAGFAVEAGVAGMPTAFVASWGRGEPVIGILAEFDALPGITQDRVPERKERPDMAAGQACGHHLFGTGSVAAAIAVRDWLEASGTPGTIRLYGTPAEEGGGGKVYMVRAGLFADVDAVLHWHASDRNAASPWASLANKSAKFRFHGVSAHAAGAPERGRSALDGVEAMNHMVNLMREHVPQETRIHYVITAGGAAPNVIPDFAEVFYYVRNPDPGNVLEIFDRVAKAAEGAALGTGTRMDYEVIHGIYAVLPNLALARAMQANLERVGGVTYDARERAFAESIRTSLPADAPPLEAAATILPLQQSIDAGGSTDVADVSWVVPTAGLETATWVPGTAAHSWQAIAAGGTSIGAKGMLVAAKSLALTAFDLVTRPELRAAAAKELAERVGPGFEYRSLVGDKPPPLDYRKPARGGG